MLTSLANYNDSDRRDVIINFDRISSGVITRTRSVWIPWIIACYRAELTNYMSTHSRPACCDMDEQFGRLSASLLGRQPRSRTLRPHNPSLPPPLPPRGWSHQAIGHPSPLALRPADNTGAWAGLPLLSRWSRDGWFFSSALSPAWLWQVWFPTPLSPIPSSAISVPPSLVTKFSPLLSNCYMPKGACTSPPPTVRFP